MGGDSRPENQSFAFSNALFALPDGTFALLRDLIVQRTGVLFDDSKRGLLADKLSELVSANGLASFIDYYYLLRYDEQAEAHWAALMDRLAVPETYFWRQAEQIQALARVVAPAHFANYPGRTLRIWSAACCTGEEPISIAIALAEANLLDTQPIKIVGTDGSKAMIERAKRGSYGERSFRQLPPELKEKYFVPAGAGRWRPIERLSAAVQWDVVNLASEDEMRRYAASDVIFCRNVFIYFSDDVIRRVARTFADFMSPDAFVFLGASESLTRLGVDLELAEVADAFAYVKLGRRDAVERLAFPPQDVLR